MEHLRWFAVPLAALGIVFVFFGLLWTAAAQLGVGAALLVLAAAIWRATSGRWTPTRP